MRVLFTITFLLLNAIYALSAAINTQIPGVYKVNVSSDSFINVRGSPDDSTKVTGKLYGNNYIYVTGFTNGFAQFYNGYVGSQYLVAATSGETYHVNVSKHNFRTGPDRDIIAVLSQNTDVIFYSLDPYSSAWAVTNQGYALMKNLTKGSGKNSGNNSGSGSGNSAVFTKPSGIDNNQLKVATEVYNFFKGKNWSNNAICGMLGNIEHESRFDPTIWEITKDKQGDARGYGLVQWTPSTKLSNWAKERGLDHTTTNTQCLKLYDEFVNESSKFKASSYCNYTYQQFSVSDKSPSYLAGCFMYNYEKPANDSSLGKRQQNAEKWCNALIK